MRVSAARAVTLTRCNKSRNGRHFSPTINYYTWFSDQVEKKIVSLKENKRRETKAPAYSLFECPRKDRRYTVPRDRSWQLFAKRLAELPRPSARKRSVQDGLTHRDRTIHVVCAGKAVGIKSAASWLHRVRQRTNIHRYFVLTRLYEQSADAAPRKLFVPQNPFSSIPWNSTRIITASVPANYVFAKPCKRVTVMYIRARRTLFQRSPYWLAVYGYDIVAPIRRNLRADIPPAASREIVLLCAPDRE